MKKAGTAILSSLAVALLVGGSLAMVTKGFQDWGVFEAAGQNIGNFFNGGNSSSSQTSSETPVTSSSKDGTLGLLAPSSQLKHVRNSNGTWTHSSITVIATVNADASDKTLAWSLAWVTTNSATVTDYISITPASTTTGGTCVVTAKKAFSGLIRLTATTVDKATATLDFSYYNEVSTIEVTPITGGATSQYPDISNALNSKSAVWIPLTKTDLGYWYKRAADDNNSYFRYFEIKVDFYGADTTIMPTFYNDLVDSNVETYGSSMALEGMKAWVKTTCAKLFDNSSVDFTLVGASTSAELSAAGALTFNLDIIGDSNVVSTDGISPNFTVDGISSSFAYNIYQYVAASTVSAIGDTVL